MSQNNKILEKMLERLLAALVNGPGLNCRPYASRQRIDFVQLGKFNDGSAEQTLLKLLGAKEATVRARVPAPRGADKPLKFARSIEAADEGGIPLADQTPDDSETTESNSPEHRYVEQQAILNKLHTIAEDARTYEQDTGVSVLNVGFPLLSLPAGTFGGGGTGPSRRVLAPLAFIPIGITVKRGAAPAVELSCRGDGVDFVLPNAALFAWLEQQTGKILNETDEDPDAKHPWREICQITQLVCTALDIQLPAMFKLAPSSEQKSNERIATQSEDATAQTVEEKSEPPEVLPSVDELHLTSAPKTDELEDHPEILTSAVLGLFPMPNQGLLRDTQAMLKADKLAGPIESFLRQGVNLEAPANVAEPQAPSKRAAVIAEERFISGTDPCQARAVRLARECAGLVVHGPPGTGKSQTITNIIGDHLARGQRVLVVCDKRTALDVVFNRLNHLGLGKLCAIVHDPRRDQRDMYMGIRKQLEELPEQQSDPRAQAKLEKADADLQAIYDELCGYRDALVRPSDHNAGTFHDLVGRWLELESATLGGTQPGGNWESINIDLTTLDASEAAIAEILQRGQTCAYAVNPWKQAAGLSLNDFLAQPMQRVRTLARDCATAAQAADATRDSAIPPFLPAVGLKQQSDARLTLADALPKAMQTAGPGTLTLWAGKSADSIKRASQQIGGAATLLQVFRAGPLDSQLWTATAGALDSRPFAEQLMKLSAYLAWMKKWYAFLPSKAKSEAAPITASFGLPLDPVQAERVRTFLTGLQTRVELANLVNSFGGEKVGLAKSEFSDDVLDRALTAHSAAVALIVKLVSDSTCPSLDTCLKAASSAAGGFDTLVDGLRKSAPRAVALEQFEAATASSKLFGGNWLTASFAAGRAGKELEPMFDLLRDRIDSLEGVIRIRQALAALPDSLRAATDRLLDESIEPDRGQLLLRKSAVAREISTRLQKEPHLQQTDAHRLQTLFDRYRDLDTKKRDLTRAMIEHRWLSIQQDRLLSTNKTKASTLGADLRRRLMVRGERALRLRQVIAVGSQIEGGDPLFDICPVWLCSPETVAQVFPREPAFDVVVFDEASQLRLEESLPVLMRGRRVVIAGDPKQLPPTRFFESTIAASGDNDDAETDQDLFEQQQAEVEDLLGAALGLDIQQCYLDVHYRSRYEQLIQFSNERFYGSRLQPIPGPPWVTHEPPVVLEQVGGKYERRRNEKEADRVVEIVREWLSRPEPPSIGIACFNLVQRDLIVEKLDDLAASDAAFGAQLEKARARQGAGSFEGLFVKNLENVQGDERDYILISTTYGPDAAGKFHRRFGPLGQAGGGRRLNVLVTRARDRIHIVTSIPADAYRSLPSLEQGQTPAGTWLLLAYLNFASRFAQAPATSTTPASGNGQPADDAHANEPNVFPSKTPSTFAQALAERLAQEHGVQSDVHWGNEGFCIDIALHDPKKPGNLKAGVLCDASRFAGADDPMQWDIFRTGILEDIGWKLHRIWTPHFYRDPSGISEEILSKSKLS